MAVEVAEFVGTAQNGEVQIPDGPPARVVILAEAGDTLAIGSPGGVGLVFTKILPLDRAPVRLTHKNGKTETFVGESWRALREGDTLTVSA